MSEYTPEELKKQRQENIKKAIAKSAENRALRKMGRPVEGVRGTAAWIIEGLIKIYEESDAVQKTLLAAHNEKALVLKTLAKLKGLDRKKGHNYRKKMKSNKEEKVQAKAKAEQKANVTPDLAARMMAYDSKNQPKGEQ